MKILVPTDFSERSKQALGEAVAWATTFDASLSLIHVIATAGWPVLESPQIQAEFVDAANDRLHALRSREIESGIPCETHVVRGVPHAEIVRFATDSNVDLIIIPTHGRSALKRFLLGSTSERVARTAACSVLVTRAKEPVGPGDLSTIIAATDFHAPSLAAVEQAAQLAEFSGAEMVVVHVIRETDYPVYKVLSSRLSDDVRRHCGKKLDAVRRSLATDIRSDTVLAEGVPSAKIVDVAAEFGADLIVVGPTEDVTRRRATLGTTAERVTRVAGCSVLIVRGALAAPM